MKRNGIVPNPAPPTVEIVRVKRGDARVGKHRELLKAVAKREFQYPADRFEGRGIVICGGGAKYFPCVYVLV